MTDAATIAKTTLAQLGGGKFIAMTGAKNFIRGNDGSLHFQLPARFATNGATRVKVMLDPTDTYTMEFFRVRKMEAVTISRHEGLYCDMLQDVFTSETGLDTHL